MSLAEALKQRAAQLGKTIVLPEGEDPRVINAAYILHESGIARPVLLADPEVFAQVASAEGLPAPGFQVLPPNHREDHYAKVLFEKRAHKGLTPEQARDLSADPLFKGALMVEGGAADACVGGAVRTTADTVRAAIQVIGPAAGIKTVSSFFYMLLPDGRALLYADCGVIPQPDGQQLADIALASAKSWRQLAQREPCVAMLAFATKGSAKDPSLEPIHEALARLKDADFAIDGELQADAALVPAVAQRKAPDSPVAGEANVLIFPNLHAGNIAYKLTERLAGATALGPVLQGLAKPMNDLSRGCSSQDIVLVSAISAIQAG